MSFISSAIAKVKHAFQAASMTAGAIASGDVSFQATPEVKITVKGTQDARRGVAAIASVTANNLMSGAILEELANSGVEHLRQAVQPITRTGRLQDSFRVVKRSPFRYDIVSDVGYAATLLGDSPRGAPSYQDLMDWMRNKPEFSGKSVGEQKRIAFAIRRSIAEGKGANRTGRSTLRQLSPTGKPVYDYVGEALNQMQPELDQIGVIVDRVVRNVT